MPVMFEKVVLLDGYKPSQELLALAKKYRREPPADAVFDYFNSYDGHQIRFARFPASRVIEPKGTVVFLPGRTEFIEKFMEDVHIFNSLGFACAAMDLRGQGMSYRPIENREKHLVRSFEPHLLDVKSFFDKKLIEKMPQPFIFMCHSAGSHVALRFMHDYPGYVSAAILVAPMVKINTGPVPAFLAQGLARLMRCLGMGALYIPGHSGVQEGAQGWRQQLTHDPDRFGDEDYFINNKDSRLAVGGVTYKWVKEAFKSSNILNSPGYAENIETPTLILQASEDKVVDNKAQTELAARMPNGKLVVIEGALHEILKETDDLRAQLWEEVGNFIDLENGSRLGAALEETPFLSD